MYGQAGLDGSFKYSVAADDYTREEKKILPKIYNMIKVVNNIEL